MSFDHLANDGRAEERHERRIERCKAPACNARIIWLKTSQGKSIPADEDTVEMGQYKFVWGEHTCHFETCKAPDYYKGRRP